MPLDCEISQHLLPPKLQSPPQHPAPPSPPMNSTPPTSHTQITMLVIIPYRQEIITGTRSQWVYFGIIHIPCVLISKSLHHVHTQSRRAVSLVITHKQSTDFAHSSRVLYLGVVVHVLTCVAVNRSTFNGSDVRTRTCKMQYPHTCRCEKIYSRNKSDSIIFLENVRSWLYYGRKWIYIHVEHIFYF